MRCGGNINVHLRRWHRSRAGAIAVQTLRVIGTAMVEGGVVGMGRLTLRRRERMVLVESRGTGMALFTLRGD